MTRIDRVWNALLNALAWTYVYTACQYADPHRVSRHVRGLIVALVALALLALGVWMTVR